MTEQKKQLHITPITAGLTGRVRVPGDKSISHRTIILGALAEGLTEASGFLPAEDTLNTLRAFQQMGVVIEREDETHVSIEGVGLRGLRAPDEPLDMGNAGTAMRLMAGVLAGQPFDSELIGDASLSQRPMGRVISPLREMGADIEADAGDRPPLHIRGGRTLQAIDYTLPVASAQVKSCVLLAGLYAHGQTIVREGAPTRDHTERMLKGFSYPIKQTPGQSLIAGGGVLRGLSFDIPGDISSAAFLLVAASLIPGSDLLLSDVGVNATRIGVIKILRLMGADITISNVREWAGEPVADLRVKYQPLRGIEIPQEWVPLAIDELPVILIAAAYAHGETVLRGAQELRVKESDRIACMAAGLKALGIHVEVLPDGMILQGGYFHGGEVASKGDHRIAMAFAIAALVARGEVFIKDSQPIATSFPNFVSIMNQLGANMRESMMKEEEVADD